MQKKTSNQIIALLPMKSNSERVPNKNIRSFAGKPLYHRVAATLEACSRIDTIVINTDSDFIAEDATRHFSKVQIIRRPPELQGDFVPMNDIIAYDLVNTPGQHYLQTHSTNPLLTQETLEAAIERYFSVINEYDSIFSVTRHQTRLYWESGEPVNHNPAELLRTQDLPPLFEENSNFFIFSQKSFVAAGNKRIGLKPLMYPMDKLEAVDIDEEFDFRLAEALYLMRAEETDHAA